MVRSSIIGIVIVIIIVISVVNTGHKRYYLYRSKESCDKNVYFPRDLRTYNNYLHCNYLVIAVYGI